MQLLIYFVQFNFVKSILCKMFTAMSFAMQYWMCTVQLIVHPVQKVQLCNCANAMQCAVTSRGPRNIARAYFLLLLIMMAMMIIADHMMMVAKVIVNLILKGSWVNS